MVMTNDDDDDAIRLLTLLDDGDADETILITFLEAAHENIIRNHTHCQTHLRATRCLACHSRTQRTPHSPEGNGASDPAPRPRRTQNVYRAPPARNPTPTDTLCEFGT